MEERSALRRTSRSSRHQHGSEAPSETGRWSLVEQIYEFERGLLIEHGAYISFGARRILITPAEIDIETYARDHYVFRRSDGYASCWTVRKEVWEERLAFSKPMALRLLSGLAQTGIEL